MNLKDKTVLITGGSEGLGFSLAQLLVKKGADVHVTGRTSSKLDDAAKFIDAKNFHTHVADVSNYEEMQNILMDIGDDIEVLVNNAGIWIEGQLESYDHEYMSTVIDVNVKGVIYTTRLVLPSMLRDNEGIILNICSTSGLGPRANQSVYSASKYAVKGFTECLSVDLQDTDIRVVGFYPGGMNTKLFEKAGAEKEVSKWMNTDKVAELLMFMLENDEGMNIDHVVVKKRISKK